MTFDSLDENLRDTYLLRAFVQGRNVRCPECQYNLRDLMENRCPECGGILKIGSAETGQKLMFAGLIGLVAGAGMSSLLLISSLLIAFRYPSSHSSNIFIFISSWGLFAEGFAATYWLWNWGAIREKAFTTKRWLAIGCWMLTIANVLAYCWCIF